MCAAYEYILRLPLSVTLIRIFSVNKRLRNLGRIQFIAESHLYTEKSIGTTFGEVSGEFPLQLSSQTHFTKIEDKKVDWLQSLKQFFINVSYHILVASLTLMAQS